jgi:hypothetical protein
VLLGSFEFGVHGLHPFDAVRKRDGLGVGTRDAGHDNADEDGFLLPSSVEGRFVVEDDTDAAVNGCRFGQCKVGT